MSFPGKRRVVLLPRRHAPRYCSFLPTPYADKVNERPRVGKARSMLILLGANYQQIVLGFDLQSSIFGATFRPKIPASHMTWLYEAGDCPNLNEMAEWWAKTMWKTPQ